MKSRPRTVLVGALGSLVLGQAFVTRAERGGSPQAAVTPPARLQVSADDLPWVTTNRYPEWFRRTYRYRELVGWLSNWQDAKEWKGIPNAEIRMGILHLDRGAVYPFHYHPAPEIYYVLRGTAEWSLGSETFVAKAGTAIHTPRNVHHKMVNIGDETLELMYIWWAPGGDTSVLNTASAMGDGWNPSK